MTTSKIKTSGRKKPQAKTPRPQTREIPVKHQHHRPQPTAAPVLRFSPRAWAKLLWLRDYGPTEVGGFGIAPADDLLYVTDVVLVRQACSWAHVAFDDAAVADFFDDQVDAGRRPEQFARHWIHTHPGDSARPSRTDEATFARVFGRADWALMMILARTGTTFARLQFGVGPGGAWEIPVTQDFSRPFAGCDLAAWEEEYLNAVRPVDGFGGEPFPAEIDGSVTNASVTDNSVTDDREADEIEVDDDRSPDAEELDWIDELATMAQFEGVDES